MKSFYVTTPIYYVNDRPHLGHAYSTVIADMLARYHKVRGHQVRFQTGTDEHGLKLERKATEMNLEPKAFVDKMAPPFKQAFDKLSCDYDRFIRTTDSDHEALVQKLWTRLQDKGAIYLGHYEDWYCVGCESFKTEKELLEGNLCPDHKKPVEKIKEESYFFKLSAYQEKLEAFYDANPNFVQPQGRYNEVRSFVKDGLRDLSISRTSFSWGIPVPGDEKHVMYVWLDALSNYLTGLGGPDESTLVDTFWSDNGHHLEVIGKDILRFHAIYWPAFLLAADITPPTQIWAHGHLTVNGEKMSKSTGNFLPPEPLADAFGVDTLRYYFMREVGFGQDGDFSHQNLIARYNGELANGLGNLLNRMVRSIVKKGLGGVVPEVSSEELQDVDRELIATAQRVSRESAAFLDSVTPHRALDSIWELVGAANRYVDTTEPWRLIKDNKERLAQVSYCVLEALRFLSIALWPFMPSKCDALREQLGLRALSPEPGKDLWPSEWGLLPAGAQTEAGTPLFPRIDPKEQEAILVKLGVVKENDEKPVAKQKKKAKEPALPPLAEPEGGYIEFDDFMKVQIKLGLIKEAESIPKSDKLLKLKIDTGEERLRQVLAGIRKHYAPENLVGKQVAVVCNLKPRKMMGYLSEGMVLAASDDDGLSVLQVDKNIQAGIRIS